MNLKWRWGKVVAFNFPVIWIAESQPHDGKRKQESIWPILQIHHQKTYEQYCNKIYRRYVWEAYKDKKISREVYDFCIKNKIADKDLIAMWKKVWIRFSLYEVEGVRKAVLHCVCSKQRTQLWVNVHLQSSAWRAESEVGSKGESSSREDCGVRDLWVSRMCELRWKHCCECRVLSLSVAEETKARGGGGWNEKENRSATKHAHIGRKWVWGGECSWARRERECSWARRGGGERNK